MIKEMPEYERPREKLLNNGVNSLSNMELLAIIIKSGTKGKSVLEISSEILSSINSLKDLKDLELLEITKIKGVGMVKAMEILAAIEIGKRIYLEKIVKKKYYSAEEIFLEYKDLMDFKVEVFYALYFDAKCNLLLKKEIYKGDSSLISLKPNEIFRYAIKIGAIGVVVMHNHPSGDPNPSSGDIDFTINLKKMADATNIILLDHIIIGNTYYSFNENNKL